MPPTPHPAPTPALPTVPIAVRHFDLAATLDSGQVFHWRRFDDGFIGLIDRTPVFLKQVEPTRLLVTPGTETAVAHYLALDHDLEAITATFPQNDPSLARAVAYAPGLRLIRQPAWECLATFITSSLKQVAHISQISHSLRQQFGQPVTWDGPTLHTYPEPAALAAAGTHLLQECRLGYRARYLADTAHMIASGSLNLSFLNDPTVSDHDALAHLQRAPGVGPKVAACVLLFAGERLGFFPIDVWIERTLKELYFKEESHVPTEKLAAFARQHFGPYRGYAQQFLFHYARTSTATPHKRRP